VFYRDWKALSTAAAARHLPVRFLGKLTSTPAEALVVSLGHGRRTSRAMAEQAEQVARPRNPVHDGRHREWAEGWRAFYPKVSRSSISFRGSEATETAIKLARQYHIARGRDSKYRALAVRPSYHGGTLGALSVTGRDSLRKPYLPLLSNQHHAPAPYCYRCPLGKSYPDCGVACADALSDLIRRGRRRSRRSSSSP
jgi:adenosylmethionine-8-amino-7-oxononanoate aminotransferase